MPQITDIEQGYPRVRAALNALADWIKRADIARTADQEFERLAPSDFDLIARDLGMSSAELRAISSKGRDAAAMLLKRMTTLHLDPAKVAHDHPAVMQDLERLCSTCESQQRCRKDMLRDPNDPVWRSYCPNDDTLRALSAEQ